MANGQRMAGFLWLVSGYRSVGDGGLRPECAMVGVVSVDIGDGQLCDGMADDIQGVHLLQGDSRVIQGFVLVQEGIPETGQLHGIDGNIADIAFFGIL